MNITLKVLPAYDGDSLLISFGDETNKKHILVDGGRTQTSFRKLKEEIKLIEKRNECIDLLIITHIDRDHIAGILSIFKDPNINKNIIKKVWFNSGNNIAKKFAGSVDDSRNVKIYTDLEVEISIKQGISLESELEKLNCWDGEIISSGHKLIMYGAKLTVLGPHDLELKKLHERWEIESGELKTDISSNKSSESSSS